MIARRVSWPASTDTDTYQLLFDGQPVQGESPVLFRDVAFGENTSTTIVVRSINSFGATDSDPLIYATTLPGKVTAILVEPIPPTA